MTPAVRALDRAGVRYATVTIDHGDVDRGFGRQAADQLGVDPTRVFKTLVVSADQPLDGHRVAEAVVIVPVTAEVDLKAAAAALGVKRVSMCEAARAERLTGYVVGGISPFGQRRRLATVLDASAAGHDTIYVSGGRRGLEVEVAPTDLVRVLDARCAAVSTS